MVFQTRRKQVHLEIEAVEGTPETLLAADLVSPAYDIEYVPSFTPFEREIMDGTFSRVANLQGERSAVVRFAMHITPEGNAGVAPPGNFSDAMQACGFSETIVPVTSVTYLPEDQDVPTLTIEVRELSQTGVAKIKQVVGARGKVTFEHVKGQPVIARFEFTGKYVEPIEGVFLAQQALGQLPPVFLGAGFSLFGVSHAIQNLTIDPAAEVALRNDANDPTGNTGGIIVGRRPIGTMDPEAPLIATENLYAELTDNTEGVLTYSLGTGAGNVYTFAAPAAQIVNNQDADRDGILTRALDLVLNRSAPAGEDEMSLAFT